MQTIGLTHGMMATVSDEDYEYLSQFNWWLAIRKKSNTFYCAGRIGGRYVLMHRVIIQRMVNIEGRFCVDHINMVGIDNTRENLRICNTSQNCMNMGKKHKNTTSQFKGVYYNKQNGNWRTRIKKDYKQIEIGSFDTQEEAAIAYNKKAIELFGEFAYLNKVA